MYWTNTRLLLHSGSVIGTVTASIFVCRRMKISPFRLQDISNPLSKIGSSFNGVLCFNRKDIDSKLSSIRNVYVSAISLSSTWRKTIPSNSPSVCLYCRQTLARDRRIPSFPVLFFCKSDINGDQVPEFFIIASLHLVPSPTR